jgi:transcriptional regulator with XRE-family HTH domain
VTYCSVTLFPRKTFQSSLSGEKGTTVEPTGDAGSVSLAERLRQLRQDAGLTGAHLAEVIGWGTSGYTKISKVENGSRSVSETEIRAWANACGRPDLADDLIAQLREAKIARVDWRRRIRAGQAPIQESFGRRTEDAAHYRNLEIAVIPGLLQTAGYARGIVEEVSAIFGTTDVDAAIQARMRRQEILYDTTKTFEFVFTEAALYLLPCPLVVMLGQYDRLLSLDLPNVTFGILPMYRHLTRVPFNSFHMLDDLLVVESYDGKHEGTDAEITAMHVRIFDDLMSESATGEVARGLIMDAATRLRQG